MRMKRSLPNLGRRTAQKPVLATLGSYHKKTWTALDIGCGIGRVLKPLSPYFHKLIGIDVSAEMIVKSKSWLRDIHNVTTVETSGVDLNIFPPCYFDLVYSYVAFQHMPRPVFNRYLEEINRVLKTQRVSCFSNPHWSSSRRSLWKTPLLFVIYEYHELQDKLKHNGFSLCHKQKIT